MATDPTTTIVPGHGTLFVANANTALPATPLTAFTLSGSAPTNWDNLGHTSKDNLPAFKRDGGGPTFLDTYLQDNVGVVYDGSNWSLAINDLQVDGNSLAMGFNGTLDADGGYIIPVANFGVPKALLLMMTDGTGKLLFYMPNVMMTLGDVPQIDAAKFLELPLSAAILGATSGVIPAAANGQAGLMKLFKTGLGTASIPVITTALPASKTANDWIELVGTGLVGVTGITFGGTNAPTFVYGSDGGVLVKVPTVTAGSNPIIITTSAGSSAAKAYTTT
jgi:hypothetical protein